MFVTILFKIFTVFSLFFCGALGRHFRIIDDNAEKALSSIVVNIFLPALLFGTIVENFDTALWVNGIILMGMSLMFAGVGFVIGFIMSVHIKSQKVKRKQFIFMTMVCNYINLPLPIVYMIYGDMGAVYLFMFSIGYSFVVWIWGFRLLAPGKISPRHWLNAPLVSMILGVCLAALGLGTYLPGFIMDALSFLGEGTIPLAGIVVGSILMGVGKDLGRAVSARELAPLLFARLVLVPLILAGLISLFEFSALTKGVLFIVAVMPSASSTPIFALNLGADSRFAAAGVFYTTLFSLITVPLYLSILL